MDELHHTEVDGLDATWRLTRCEIEIVSVHRTSGMSGKDVVFRPGTDLVDARHAHKKWNRLWDKVQGEFWAALMPPIHRSSDTRWFGERRPNPMR